MTDFLGRLGISIPRYRRAKVSLNLDRTHGHGQGIMQCWLYYATSNDARESFYVTRHWQKVQLHFTYQQKSLNLLLTT
jgi:hypothetical protein